MTTTYLCGLCPFGQEYRSTDIDDVRHHITETDDNRHRDHTGHSPEAVIYRAGEERDGMSLSIGLEEAATADDEKRIIAALLEYPYISARRIARVTDTSYNIVARVMDEYPRVALERERRALDYVREDTRYRQRPDGEPKQPTIDDTEREIIRYALDNPDDSATDVKDALDLDMGVEDIKEIVRTKTICPLLPSTPEQRDALLYGHENPEVSAFEIGSKFDYANAKSTLYQTFTDADLDRAESVEMDGFPETYLNLDRVADMKLSEEELFRDAHELGFPVHPPDERPTMHRHKDTLLYLYHYRGLTLDSTGRICDGVAGPTIADWLERHGAHPRSNDYEFDIEDLYHGHDEKNDYEYAHLIPSSRESDEEPEKVVREAGNVRYEGPPIGATDDVTNREPSIITERNIKSPGKLPDDPSVEDFIQFFDTDAITSHEIPEQIRSHLNKYGGSMAVTLGALLQLPTDIEIPGPAFKEAIAEIADFHRKSIQQQLQPLAEHNYITHERENVNDAKTILVSEHQQKALAGEHLPPEEELAPEPESEPEPPERPEPVQAESPERPTVIIDEPKPLVEGEMAHDTRMQAQTETKTLVAGQHPDDMFDAEEYLYLIELVASDDGNSPIADRVYRKLVRNGGLALAEDE